MLFEYVLEKKKKEFGISRYLIGFHFYFSILLLAIAFLIRKCNRNCQAIQHWNIAYFTIIKIYIMLMQQLTPSMSNSMNGFEAWLLTSQLRAMIVIQSNQSLFLKKYVNICMQKSEKQTDLQKHYKLGKTRTQCSSFQNSQEKPQQPAY